jgi:Icc-related predicted phosphoesterase
MGDFQLIRLGEERFSANDSSTLHEDSVRWLNEQFDAPQTMKTVVVSHHAPSHKSVVERFIGDRLSPAFASLLEPLVLKGQPEIWVHGHMHDALDYELHGTRVICNPRGYPNESTNSGFDPQLTVEIT